MDSSKHTIHSANDWEHADIGDDSRKDKFLRLMGAKKKEHKGKIVIGEETKVQQHTKTGQEFKEIDKNLEEGYNQGMEHNCTGSVNHTGIGYPENTDDKSKEDEGKQEELLDVKSANKWEQANLGDTGRKNKFLRLMGASKKEHTGKFVIGDTKEKDANERKIPSEKDLESGLEMQYNQGLGLRLSGAARRHIGLGFQEEPLPPKAAEESQDGSEENKDADHKQEEGQSQKGRENVEHNENDGSREERVGQSGGNYDRKRDHRGGYKNRDYDSRRDNQDRNYDKRGDERDGDKRRGDGVRRDERIQERGGYDGGRGKEYGRHGSQQGGYHQPQQHSQMYNRSHQNTTSYNQPVAAAVGFSQPPGQTSYNQPSSSYIKPADNQANPPAGYQAGFVQHVVGGNQVSYLPPAVLNQPPPPPPSHNAAQTVVNPPQTNWQNSNYNSLTKEQNLQYSSVPTKESYQKTPQQPFVPPQPNTQPSQHPSAVYFQKPTMTFVKSKDS